MAVRKHGSGQAGFSLLEAMIAAGLMAMVAAGFASAMKHQFNAQSRVQQRSDLTAIRSMLSDRIDCAATLKYYKNAAGLVVCPAGLVNVRDQGDHILIDGRYPSFLPQATKVGSWTLRALCESSTATPGLVIEASRPRTTATGLLDSTESHFYTDPLSGVALSWEQKPSKNFPGSELYFTNARPCAAAITKPPTLPSGWVPSPGGKCVTSRTLFNRHQNGGPHVGDAAFTTASIACPAAFPLETQTMVTPSGCACGWMSSPMMNSINQVVGGNCTEMMVDQQMQYNQCGLHPLNKKPHFYTQQEWNDQIAASKACEGSNPQAQCTVTCCNL